MPPLMNTSLLCRLSQIAAPVSLAVVLFGATGCRPAAPAERVVEKEKVAAGEADSSNNGELRTQSTRVTLEFPGGTLGDLRNHLPASPAEPFNLIVSDEFASLPVPAFSVRDADSSALARALTHHLYSYGVKIESMDLVNAGAPVYVTFSESGSYSQAGNLLLRSLSMEPAEAARLSSAVQNAWKALSKSDVVYGAVIRYHPETRQLFVSGPSSAMAALDEVLRTFPKDKSAASQP